MTPGARARTRRGPDRRGLAEWEHVLGLVLLVGVIIAVLGIIIEYKMRTADTYEDGACASQIATHAQISDRLNGVAAPSITCPTRLVDVKTTDETEAKRAVAEQMKRCWGLWGKGELQLFGNAEGTYCHVCSMVRVQGTEINGLTQYLDEARATKTQTYSQYLVGQKYGELYSAEQFQQAASARMSTEKPIAVIFYYKKGLSDWNKFRNQAAGDTRRNAIGGFLMGGSAGAVLGGKVGSILPGKGTVAGAFIGGVVGAGTGVVVSFMGVEQPDYIAAVIARPLDPAEIQTLGCQYDPVSN